MPFIPHTPEETREMLATVGVRTLDDLFADIPASMRPKSFNLPKGQSEAAICNYFEDMAARNRTSLISFLGAGFYNHYIPKAVDALAGRSEFYTAYTPYQAECSQGTLQAIFEFQTAVTRLLDMECANASIYDGGTSMFEAAMMAVRATKRSVIVVDEAVNPVWRQMLHTYAAGVNVTFRVVPQKNGLSDMDGLKAAVDALAGRSEFYTAYTPYQAEPLSFGGPYLGLMACRKSLVRQMPGRIVGRTQDLDGKTGYVLTLQAREQHIRRAKATSNICSNQALCALRALIHMCLLGPDGLARTAENNMALARYAVERLTALPGVRRLNDAPYGNEVALRLPCSASRLVNDLAEHGCVPGYPVARAYPGMDDVLLLACTESNNRHQIGFLAESMGALL